MRTKTAVTVTIDNALYMNLCNRVGEGYIGRNFSDAVCGCIEVGLKIHEHRKMLEDPIKAKQFIEKMMNKMRNDKMIGWLASLTDTELDGVIMAVTMERENR